MLRSKLEANEEIHNSYGWKEVNSLNVIFSNLSYRFKSVPINLTVDFSFCVYAMSKSDCEIYTELQNLKIVRLL